MENTSKEYSKTVLQRLSQKGPEVKVHEIIDDNSNYDSKKMNMNVAEEAKETTTALNKSEGRNSLGIEGRLTEASHRHPQVMRFCPSLSTNEIDISVSGFTARALQKDSTARANMVLHEGVHYWEVTCPIRCTSIQIGVFSKGKDTFN